MTAIARQNGSGSRSGLPMTLAALRFLRRAIGRTEERAAQAVFFSESSEATAPPRDLRRLQLMADAAARAVVTVPDGRVIVGLEVVVRDGGFLTSYAIMPPGMGTGEQTVVSAESPLGSALLGHRAGDIVTVMAPEGNRRVEIVEVR